MRSAVARARLPLLLVAMAATLALPGCLAPLRQPRAARGPALRVLTFNVNWGFPAPHEALAVIRESDADVVVLQESTPRWERYLDQKLHDLYPHARHRHSSGAGGQSVFSKRPVVERSWRTPAQGWFPIWILDVETPLGAVQLVSVHLKPPLKEGGRVGVSAYLGVGAVHRSEIEEVTAQLDPERPTIYAGDFNEGDTGDALKWLTAQGFVDALPLFDRSSDTWRWRTKWLTLGDRYDHIVYSRHFECVNAYVIERGRSDHLAVLAELEGRVAAPTEGAR